MNTQSEHLQSINEIRDIMERATQFPSLSGLSGVFAGVLALTGAFLIFLRKPALFLGNSFVNTHHNNMLDGQDIRFIFLIGFAVLILALLVVVLFTIRRAKHKQLAYWNSVAKRLLVNLFIPLVTGGLFCLLLVRYGLFYLVAPSTLIFYGLALVNASKYTLRDVRYLGITEIVLGLLAMLFVDYSLIIWTVGFGLMHIVYGLAMYYKYERFDS